jgi:hypothetical protein
MRDMVSTTLPGSGAFDENRLLPAPPKKSEASAQQGQPRGLCKSAPRRAARLVERKIVI